MPRLHVDVGQTVAVDTAFAGLLQVDTPAASDTWVLSVVSIQTVGNLLRYGFAHPAGPLRNREPGLLAGASGRPCRLIEGDATTVIPIGCMTAQDATVSVHVRHFPAPLWKAGPGRGGAPRGIRPRLAGDSR